MAKKTKSIPLAGNSTVSEIIELLSKERLDAKIIMTNQWNEPVTRNLRFTWEEPPMFKVEPDKNTLPQWNIINTKTSEVEASGIRLRQIADYICADLNKRLDK